MLQIYEIDYDSAAQEYFITLTEQDKLVIIIPPWLSIRNTPTYRLNGETLKISKDRLRPTHLELHSGEKLEIYQQATFSMGDFLPKLTFNGVTSTNKYRIPLLDRAIMFMPLLLVFLGGLHGGFTGSVGVALNRALIRAPWPRWQKTCAMLTTTATAAIIYFSGIITVAVYHHMHNPNIGAITKPALPPNQLYTEAPSPNQTATNTPTEEPRQAQDTSKNDVASDPKAAGYGNN